MNRGKRNENPNPASDGSGGLRVELAAIVSDDIAAAVGAHAFSIDCYGPTMQILHAPRTDRELAYYLVVTRPGGEIHSEGWVSLKWLGTLKLVDRSMVSDERQLPLPGVGE